MLTPKVTRRQHAAKLRDGGRVHRRVSRWVIEVKPGVCGEGDRTKATNQNAPGVAMRALVSTTPPDEALHGEQASTVGPRCPVRTGVEPTAPNATRDVECLAALPREAGDEPTAFAMPMQTALTLYLTWFLIDMTVAIGPMTHTANID